MIDKWAVPGELGVMIEAYGGEEIARLKAEDIAQDVTSVKLVQTQLVTTLYRLHEAREEIKLLTGQRENLRADNTSLRVVKARYEGVQYKPYMDMILSALLGFGMSEYVRSPEERMPLAVLIGTGLVIACSIGWDVLRRKGGNK